MKTLLERIIEESRLRTKHKAKLEVKYKTVGNPKANLLYEMAWNYGHSAGFEEVEIYYADGARLIT